MEHQGNALPAGGAVSPVQAVPQEKKLYAVTPRDRLFLALTFAFCFLWVHACLAAFFRLTGGLAGLTASVYAWYALLLSYRGAGLLERRSSQVLLAANLLLASFLALGSSWYFRAWNTLFLLVLLPVHALSESGQLPWHRPAMFLERLSLLFSGLFGHLGAAPAALAQGRGTQKRTGALLLGLGGGLVLLWVLLPVLASADALFAAATEGLRLWVRVHLAEGLWQALLGLALTPFCFGLLYAIRNPAPLKRPWKDLRPMADPLAFLLMLGALVLLYLLFLGVQSAGLFGGPAYLAQRGISYAEWARSGFFQMVGVSVLNLTVLLAALSLSRREGGLWRGLRLLAGALVLESLILLASACWRMTLYVSAYGLSFKRFMTYWGMGIMALLFLAALWKVLRPDFAFCRRAFPLLLAGWLAVNCVPVDFLVARNQVDRYLSGESANLDAAYLLYSLSYDALSQLERVDSGTVFSIGGRSMPLANYSDGRREDARRECSDWRTWSLSACLAAE